MRLCRLAQGVTMHHQRLLMKEPLFYLAARIRKIKNRPMKGGFLLLRFLVCDVLLAPLAELGELQAILELFLVLVAVIVHPLALGTFHFCEIVL